MWVNGEKYIFSDHVLEKGTALYQSFLKCTQMLPKISTLSHVQDLKSLLTSFDQHWATYEQAYIGELMVIEHDARRFIRNLTAGANDSPSVFLNMVGEINAVANLDGMGRKDFDIKVVETCQKLARSDCPSIKAIAKGVDEKYQ